MRRFLSQLRTVPLYTSAVATCHGTLWAEPRPPLASRLRRRPAHDSAPVAMGFRDVPPGLPSTMSLSTTDAGASSPFTPSAPRVTDPHLRHRRSAPFGIVVGGGLFLQNNTHITRVASALSLNHRRTVHQTNRSRTWTETNHRAGRGMTLPKTIFPNRHKGLFSHLGYFYMAHMTVMLFLCQFKMAHMTDKVCSTTRMSTPTF
jgi:hypothetical protein